MRFLKLKRAIVGAGLLALCAAQLNAAQAAGFKLTDSEGRTHSLAAYRGKWVLVNFWATWCTPCVQEIPEFAALYNRRKDRDLVVIGVAVDYTDGEEVRRFAQRLGMSYPLVLADGAAVAQFGKVNVLPVSYLYDRTGKLVRHRIGPLSTETIEKLLDPR